MKKYLLIIINSDSLNHYFNVLDISDREIVFSIYKTSSDFCWDKIEIENNIAECMDEINNLIYPQSTNEFNIITL